MSSVQWLKLNNTKLNEIPEELGNLLKLVSIFRLSTFRTCNSSHNHPINTFQEHLSLKRNQLEKLHGELTELTSLRTLNVRQNNIKSSGVPPDLFQLEELTTLDFSRNNLKEVPEGLEKAHSLLVLNLSHNKYVSRRHIRLFPFLLFIKSRIFIG